MHVTGLHADINQVKEGKNRCMPRHSMGSHEQVCALAILFSVRKHIFHIVAFTITLLEA